MHRLRFVVLFLIALLAACSPSAGPTATPVVVIRNPVTPATSTATPNPANTPTAVPTRAPLPTSIPTDDTPSLSEIALSQRAKIRTVHAAPGLPRVDVYLGQQIAGFSMDYGEATGQAEVVAGDYLFRLIESGGRADDESVLETFITLEDSAEVVALVHPDETVTFIDENMDALTGQQSRVRVVQLIPDAPPTSIRNNADGDIFDSILYGEVSEPVILVPGDATLTFDNILTDYEITLRPRRTYTLVLYGTLERPEVITYDFAAPARAEVLFANLSDEIGSVDIYLNDERISDGIGFEGTDSLLNLPVDTYEVTVYETGADPSTTTPVLTGRILLNPDDEVFALLMGPASDLRLVTYQEPDDQTGADETRITFISAVSGVPVLRELHNDDLRLSLTYGQPTSLVIPSAEYNFEFVVDLEGENYTSVGYIDWMEFEPGISHLYLITRSPDTIDDDPLEFLRAVGTREPEPDPDATRPPQNPQAYFVNTLDRPLEITVDNQPFETALAPGQASALFTIPGGTYRIAIADAETREALYSTSRTLVMDNTYSLVFFGDLEQQNYAMADFAWEDTSGPMFDMQNGAILRLVNVSLNTGQILAPGYEFAVPPENRPIHPLATRRALGFTDEPLPLPLEVRGFTNTGVSSGLASEAVIIPSGDIDLYAYNTSSLSTRAIIFDVELQPQRRYDFIVTSQPGEPELTGILTAFPLP